MEAAFALLVAVMGVAAWRWGTTRSIVLDDRGPRWFLAYQLGRRFGIALAGLGLAAAAAFAFSRC
jgi:hypothetical protein